MKPALLKHRNAAIAAALVILSLTALAVRLHGISVEARPLSGDSTVYHRLATNLLDGKPYSRDAKPPYEPEWQRTFLYPGFIAATYGLLGRDPHHVYVLQAILTSLVLVPLVWLVARCFSPVAPERIAWAAAVLAAFNPLLTLGSAGLMREPLQSVLFAALLIVTGRAWKTNSVVRWLAVGTVTGICIQNRVEYLVCIAIIPRSRGVGTPSRTKVLAKAPDRHRGRCPARASPPRTVDDTHLDKLRHRVSDRSIWSRRARKQGRAAL